MLLALLILAVMTALAFVFSSIVYRELSISRAYDDSLQSYYAAESGIERSLDIVTEHRQNRELLGTTLTAVENYATDAAPVTLSAADASYVIDSSATTNTTTALEVLIESLYQIDLYDPDDPINTLMSAESMRVLWNVPASCSSTTQLEFTFQEYNSSSFGLENDSVYKQLYTCGVESPPSGYDCQATSNWPAANTNYTIQIRASNCEYSDATISLYTNDDALGAEVNIPSVVNIAAVGSGNSSQRAMRAHTKWVPSASGLSEFVLFSTAQIVKGATQTLLGP